MAEGAERLDHLWVRGRASDRELHRTGRGDPAVRDVERRSHGRARRRELEEAFDELEVRRAATAEELEREELRALGVVVVLEGADAQFPLRVDSLERLSRHRAVPRRPQWLLLSVTPARNDQPERATVWVSDEYRAQFVRLFEDFLEHTTEAGNPRNRELVANIARIRAVVLDDLWQSDGRPQTSGVTWWELWLRPTGDAVQLLDEFAATRPMDVHNRVLRLADRIVAWVRADWSTLGPLPFTAVPLAEIRQPEFADTVEDLPRDDQDELTEDLTGRVTAAGAAAPTVCHLDTGVRRSHVLLDASLAPQDVHSIVDGPAVAVRNHGTLMAGLALYGDLESLLLGTATVALSHRLESVKILPDAGAHDPSAYGLVTAEAVSLPEATAQRPRVFCLPITATPDRAGEPSLWSASVDALAAGVDIAASPDGISLLGPPDPDAARLFVISAGNVEGFGADYRTVCDLAAIEDPAHAWNALTVGAHTERVHAPDHPDLAGWLPLAEHGDISPHSRTSLLFASRMWPIKPDICMEGGNVLHDGATDFHGNHPLLSLRTTDSRDDLALSSANATSAATAQAARLAALAMARYPSYWPETIRGLLPHAAEWTPIMRAEIDGAAGKVGRLALLRRYGWGVPSELAVLDSSRTAVTLVTQDEFQPFTGPEFRSRVFRLHELPWPVDVLAEMGATDVSLRVTLSYFIEPTASRRGWRRRYAYPSHGLRFELKKPTETVAEFVRRVNRDAQQEEDDAAPRTTRGTDRWLVGPNQRNLGSLHQDVWEGSAADLAASGVLAVHPVAGWWKNNRREDRQGCSVRYALLVSLRTEEQGVDLYTPIATEIAVPVKQVVET